jgi:hypothetical protein
MDRVTVLISFHTSYSPAGPQTDHLRLLSIQLQPISLSPMFNGSQISVDAFHSTSHFIRRKTQIHLTIIKKHMMSTKFQIGWHIINEDRKAVVLQPILGAYPLQQLSKENPFCQLAPFASDRPSSFQTSLEHLNLRSPHQLFLSLTVHVSRNEMPSRNPAAIFGYFKKSSGTALTRPESRLFLIKELT